MTDFPMFETTPSGLPRQLGDPLPVPSEASRSYDKHGVLRYRWTAPTTISRAFRVTTSTNLLGVAVHFDIDGEKASGFHLLNPRLLAGTATAVEARKHTVMNKRSMEILAGLVSLITDEHLSASLLNRTFPPKDGTESPLVGVNVTVHLVDEPDTRPGSEPGSRRTVVEKYASR